NPFSEIPDVKFYYKSISHTNVLSKLAQGLLEGKGIIQITGEVGTGKTLLSRFLVKYCQGSDVNFATILRSNLDGEKLVSLLVDDFALSKNALIKNDNTDSYINLEKYFLDSTKKSIRNIIIIDEAQNLTLKAFETIRLISNLEYNNKKLVQIILMGQPELDIKLSHYDYRQFNQRISLRLAISPLELQETENYIKYRLDIAQFSNQLGFSKKALIYIHKKSKGIPRIINHICNTILEYAEESNQRYIDIDTVKNVISNNKLIYNCNEKNKNFTLWPFN
ncbi:MAG: AAA family ATPase, partial [Oligoflexia bacterium]|nr:AAA family ATPase [Oligoflexia bacterium]